MGSPSDPLGLLTQPQPNVTQGQQLSQDVLGSSQPQMPTLDQPARGGRIKQLLSNFFQGAGDAMTHAAGLPTQYELEKQRFGQQIQLMNAQSMEGVRRAQEQQYGYTPMQMPDGSYVNIMNKDVGKVAAAQQRAQSQEQTNKFNSVLKAAGIGKQFNPDTGQLESLPFDQLSLPQQAGIQRAQSQTELDQARALGLTDWNSPVNQLKVMALRAKAAQQTTANQLKQSQLTNSTRTMVEAAPKVIGLIDRVNDSINKMGDQLGPAGSRWAEFWAGKVGEPNEEFTKLRTNVGLLTTLLMRMHVGARGGEYIMKHFQDLMDSGKQSPTNMRAALGEIEAYAHSVQAEGSTGFPSAGNGNSGGSQAAPEGTRIRVGNQVQVKRGGKWVPE